MKIPGFGPRSLRALGALVAVVSIGGCSSEKDDPAPPVYMGPGCAILQAEHPAYTTVARDAALCGNSYALGNIEDACGSFFHVCRESEWHARYPEGVSPGGTLTTWGAAQADRCAGFVWQANQPVDATTWDGDVCGSPYNPWNSGKYLFADDGTTILKGVPEPSGDGACCSWDLSFEATVETVSFAVYCCKD